MLVLSRKSGEKLRIGREIVLTVVEVEGNRVRFGIEAPPHVDVFRAELLSPSSPAGPATARTGKHLDARN
jgi:carbon storage regulator